MPVAVRAARPQDRVAVARLLYLSAAGTYDRYAGDRGAALRLLERAYTRRGTSASAEVTLVCERDGRVCGALAGFSASEGGRRASAFLLLTLRSLPPWRWAAALRLYRLGGRLTPPAPPACFYVDGLATDPGARRIGAARAMLAAAEERARALHLPALALDTALDNEAARALYESCGFKRTHAVPAAKGLPAFVGYVKRLA